MPGGYLLEDDGQISYSGMEKLKTIFYKYYGRFINADFNRYNEECVWCFLESKKAADVRNDERLIEVQPILDEIYEAMQGLFNKLEKSPSPYDDKYFREVRQWFDKLEGGFLKLRECKKLSRWDRANLDLEKDRDSLDSKKYSKPDVDSFIAKAKEEERGAKFFADSKNIPADRKGVKKELLKEINLLLKKRDKISAENHEKISELSKISELLTGSDVAKKYIAEYKKYEDLNREFIKIYEMFLAYTYGDYRDSPYNTALNGGVFVVYLERCCEDIENIIGKLKQYEPTLHRFADCSKGIFLKNVIDKTYEKENFQWMKNVFAKNIEELNKYLKYYTEAEQMKINECIEEQSMRYAYTEAAQEAINEWMKEPSKHDIAEVFKNPINLAQTKEFKNYEEAWGSYISKIKEILGGQWTITLFIQESTVQELQNELKIVYDKLVKSREELDKKIKKDDETRKNLEEYKGYKELEKKRREADEKAKKIASEQQGIHDVKERIRKAKEERLRREQEALKKAKEERLRREREAEEERRRREREDEEERRRREQEDEEEWNMQFEGNLETAEETAEEAAKGAQAQREREELERWKNAKPLFGGEALKGSLETSRGVAKPPTAVQNSRSLARKSEEPTKLLGAIAFIDNMKKLYSEKEWYKQKKSEIDKFYELLKSLKDQFAIRATSKNETKEYIELRKTYYNEIDKPKFKYGTEEVVQRSLKELLESYKIECERLNKQIQELETTKGGVSKMKEMKEAVRKWILKNITNEKDIKLLTEYMNVYQAALKWYLKARKDYGGQRWWATQKVFPKLQAMWGRFEDVAMAPASRTLYGNEINLAKVQFNAHQQSLEEEAGELKGLLPDVFGAKQPSESSEPPPESLSGSKSFTLKDFLEAVSKMSSQIKLPGEYYEKKKEIQSLLKKGNEYVGYKENRAEFNTAIQKLKIDENNVAPWNKAYAEYTESCKKYEELTKTAKFGPGELNELLAYFMNGYYKDLKTCVEQLKESYDKTYKFVDEVYYHWCSPCDFIEHAINKDVSDYHIPEYLREKLIAENEEEIVKIEKYLQYAIDQSEENKSIRALKDIVEKYSDDLTEKANKLNDALSLYIAVFNEWHQDETGKVLTHDEILKFCNALEPVYKKLESEESKFKSVVIAYLNEESQETVKQLAEASTTGGKNAAKYEKQLKELQGQLKLLGVEKADLEKSLAEDKSTITELEGKLTKAQEEAQKQQAAAEKAKRASEQTIAEKEGKITELSGKLEELEKQLETAKNEAKKAKEKQDKDANEKQALVDAKEAALAEVNAAIEKLKKEKDEAMANAEASQKTSAELKAKVEKLEADIEAEKARAAVAEGETKATKQQLEKAEKAQTEAEEKLKEATEAKEKAAQKAEEATFAVSQARTKAEQAEKEMKKVQRELAELKKANKDLASQLGEAQGKIKTKEDALVQLRQELEEAKKQLNDEKSRQSAATKASEETLEKLRKELESAKKKAEEAQTTAKNQLDAKESTVAARIAEAQLKATEDIGHAKQAAEELKKQSEQEAEAKVAAAKAKVTEIQARIDELNAKTAKDKEEWSKKVKELEKKQKDFEDQAKQAAEEKKKVQQELEKAKKAKGAAEAELQKLKDEQTKKEREEIKMPAEESKISVSEILGKILNEEELPDCVRDLKGAKLQISRINDYLKYLTGKAPTSNAITSDDTSPKNSDPLLALGYEFGIFLKNYENIHRVMNKKLADKAECLFFVKNYQEVCSNLAAICEDKDLLNVGDALKNLVKALAQYCEPFNRAYDNFWGKAFKLHAKAEKKKSEPELSVSEIIKNILNEGKLPDYVYELAGNTKLIEKIKVYLKYARKETIDNDPQLKLIGVHGGSLFHDENDSEVRLSETSAYKEFDLCSNTYDSKIQELEGNKISYPKTSSNLEYIASQLKEVYEPLVESIKKCKEYLDDLLKIKAEREEKIKKEKEEREERRKKAKKENGLEEKLTLGKLFQQIISDVKNKDHKLNSVIVKNYGSIIKEIKKKLVYYNGCYKDDVCLRDRAVKNRVKVLGLTETDLFTEYTLKLMDYQNTVIELLSSNEASDVVDDSPDNERNIKKIFEKLKAVYEPLSEAEEAINKHIKDTKGLRDNLVNEYVEISKECRKLAKQFNTKKDVLDELDKNHVRLYHEVLELQAQVDAKNTELSDAHHRRFVSQNRLNTLQGEKTDLESALTRKKAELETHKQAFETEQQKWKKYATNYETLSQQKIDLGKALINAGVAKEAEKKELFADIEKTGASLAEIDSTVQELQKAYDEALREVPSMWESLKSKLSGDKNNVNRSKKLARVKQLKKELDAAKDKEGKKYAKLQRLNESYQGTKGKITPEEKAKLRAEIEQLEQEINDLNQKHEKDTEERLEQYRNDTLKDREEHLNLSDKMTEYVRRAKLEKDPDQEKLETLNKSLYAFEEKLRDDQTKELNVFKRKLAGLNAKLKSLTEAFNESSAVAKGKEIRFVHKDDATKEEITAAAATLQEEAIKKEKEKIEGRRGKTIKEIERLEKEENSAEAKKCLEMCKKYIPVLEGILKKNPHGFPFIGQGYYVMKEVEKASGQTYKEKFETWLEKGQIKLLLSTLDSLYGKGGIMEKFASNRFVCGYTGNYGYSMVISNVERIYRHFKLQLKKEIFMKKLDDLNQSDPKVKGLLQELGQSAKLLNETFNGVISECQTLISDMKNNAVEKSGVLSKAWGKIKKKIRSIKRDKMHADTEGSTARDNKTVALLNKYSHTIDAQMKTISDNYNKFNEFLKPGKNNNLYGAIDKYNGYIQNVLMLLQALAGLVPEVGPIISASVGVLAGIVKLGAKAVKLGVVNYAWGPTVIDEQVTFKISCKNLCKYIDDTNEIYDKLINFGSDNVLENQEYTEEVLKDIVKDINLLLLTLTATFYNTVDKLEMYKLNWHVSKYQRALYELMSLFKRLTGHLMDYDNWGKILPDFRPDVDIKGVKLWNV